MGDGGLFDIPAPPHLPHKCLALSPHTPLPQTEVVVPLARWPHSPWHAATTSCFLFFVQGRQTPPDCIPSCCLPQFGGEFPTTIHYLFLLPAYPTYFPLPATLEEGRGRKERRRRALSLLPFLFLLDMPFFSMTLSNVSYSSHSHYMPIHSYRIIHAYRQCMHSALPTNIPLMMD